MKLLQSTCQENGSSKCPGRMGDPDSFQGCLILGFTGLQSIRNGLNSHSIRCPEMKEPQHVTKMRYQ